MTESVSNWDYKEVFDNLQIAVQAIEKAVNIAYSLELNSSIHTLLCGLYNMGDNVAEVVAEILAERLENEVKDKVKNQNQDKEQ